MKGVLAGISMGVIQVITAGCLGMPFGSAGYWGLFIVGAFCYTIGILIMVGERK